MTRECRRGAPRRLRVPALRAVPPHDRGAQHRLRAGGAPARDPPASGARSARGSRTAGADGHRRARRPLAGRSSPAASGSAWRWPGRWRSSRICCCWTSRSARSTPRCAGPAPLAARAARPHRPDHHLRHPRPGRGAGAGRPGRGHAGRADRAGGCAGAALRRSGQRVRS